MKNIVTVTNLTTIMAHSPMAKIGVCWKSLGIQYVATSRAVSTARKRAMPT
jgi:hypothetical protein